MHFLRPWHLLARASAGLDGWLAIPMPTCAVVALLTVLLCFGGVAQTVVLAPVEVRIDTKRYHASREAPAPYREYCYSILTSCYVVPARRRGARWSRCPTFSIRVFSLQIPPPRVAITRFPHQ